MSGEGTSRQGLPPPSPLCLFYFSHPFKIGTPENVHVDTSEPRHQYRGTMGNVIQRSRRIPRRRFPGVRHLGSYLLATAGVQESKPTPSLDEVLRIIREAWTTPRTSSLDREAGTSNGSATRRRPMGTTGRKVSPGGHRTRHQLPSNPRPGLPHRRYSVPETVMRKYTLTKQRELFLESPADTSTTTATAPAAPCPECSSESENRLSETSQLEEGSGSDRSGFTEHFPQGSEVSQGEEDNEVTQHLSESSRDSQGGEEPSLHFQGQEDSRLEQDEMHEPKEEQPHSPQQQVPPRIRRKSSPSRSKPPSRTSTVLDTVSEETGNDLAATSAQERDDWTSSSATLGIPMSTSATNGSSPHEDIAAAVTLPQRNITSCPAVMELMRSPDDNEEEMSTKEDPVSTTSREETPSSPSRTRQKEEDDTMPNSTLADDLSSTQTFGCSSTEPSRRPQSQDQSGHADLTTSSPEPHTTQRDDLSSTQTFCGTSTEPNSRPQSHNQPEDADQATPSTELHSSQRDDFSSVQTSGGNSTEPSSGPQSHKRLKDNDQTTSSTEPHSSQRDDLSSTQTFGGNSTEPSSRPQSHEQQGDVEETRNTSTGIFSSPEDTMEPHTTRRDELSSSQTFGIVSEETVKSSQDVRTSSTMSEESTLGRISGESTSTPEARAGSSTSPERLPPSEFEKTTSGYSGEGTTTECCVSTSPSCSLAMSTSSPDQPVTERSTSTQDQTFSIRSESVTFGRPVSVIRTPKSITPTPPPPPPAAMSDSEQSLGHIEFMNKDEANFSGLFSKTLINQNNNGGTRSNSADYVFGSEVKSPEETRNNVRDIACQVEMCESTDTSISADEGTHSKQQTSLPTTEDSGHITEDVSFCGTNKLNTEIASRAVKDVEVLQKRSWEIIIQPKCYGAMLGASNARATFRTLSNKISVLPSKVQEAEFFNGPKTYLIIRQPSQKPISTAAECYPTKVSTSTAKEQVVIGKPETESVDGAGPYGWSRLSEEERTVRMQHQKHRLWMNRRLASAHALPRSPDPTAAEGALSACVGPGSVYREPPLRDTQLVVPRYSALPRSVSMLVNTSSGECSSNSNSDSECLSLVDSLDESPMSRSKHDITNKLLPEGATTTGRNVILPATPRGKGKAFFVSMAGGQDKMVPVDVAKEPVVAKSMPDKLKRKLSQRQQLMEQRRKKKQGACHSVTENSAEELQKFVQEMAEITQKGTVPQTVNAELQSPQVEDTADGRISENISKTTEVQKSRKVTSPQLSLDAEIKNYLKRRSKEIDKGVPEVQNMMDSSLKPDDIKHVPSESSVKSDTQAGPSEVLKEICNLRSRSRRKSKREKIQSNSPELSENLDERGSKEAHKNMEDSQERTNSFLKSDDPSQTLSEKHLQTSSSEIGNETDNSDNRSRRISRTKKVPNKFPELAEGVDDKQSTETSKNTQEAQNIKDTSPKSDDITIVHNQTSQESHSPTSSSEVVNEIRNLGNRVRRKSQTERIQNNSPELSKNLDERRSKELDKNTQDHQNVIDSALKLNNVEHIPSQTFTETHSQSSSEVGNDISKYDNRRRRKSKTEKIQSNPLESPKTLDDHNETEKTESQNEGEELAVEKHTDMKVSDSPVVTSKSFKVEEGTASSINNNETTENKSPETVNILRVTTQIQPHEQDIPRNKSKRKCKEPLKRAKSEPPPKVNKSSEEESESVVENTTQMLTAAENISSDKSATSKEGTVLSEQQESEQNNRTLDTEKVSTQMNQVEKNNEVCKFKNPIVGSPQKLTTAGKSVPALQTEMQEGTKLAESLTAIPRRLSSKIPIDHANCQRTDYGTGTIKNRPQHRKHRVRKKSPPGAVSSNNSTPATGLAGEAHSARMSQIPVMKSPVSMRRSLLMDPTGLRSSQLPVLRSRFLQSPPVRRSGNLRFQQRFEVIPEERSASLESSTEDQATNQQKIIPKPVRPVSEAPYSALHNRYRPVVRKSYQNNNSSSSSNQDESRIPVRRPVMGQSRIPRPAFKDEVRPVQQSQCYTGSRAALAPHMDDTDLVTLSKGWLNFYLLKDGRGTPDSIIDEASSANISDREDRHSAKRRRGSRVKRTVTVVGADENRVRQYTLSHQSNEDPSSPQDLSPEQALEETKSERPSSQGTTLPALDASNSRRPSLEKLPLELPETEDSDHSTTYLCLPSPNRQHRIHSSLLEGSGELACSESSSVSSSDEGEKTVFPMRWPSRPMRSRVHRSRSRSNHCRRDLLQSYLQTGTGPGSAGWTVTVAGNNGGLQQQPPDLEMHVTFPANVRRTAASQSDSGLGEDNNGGGAGAEDEDSKSRKGEEELKADDDEDVTQTHRWTVVLKNQGAADRVPELGKSGKRPHHCLPDLSYHHNQSKNSKKPIKKIDGNLPVSSTTDEDTGKGGMQKRLSQLWPKVQKILESKVIIRKASGHFSQEVKSVSQLLENDIGEMMVRSGLAIKGSAITPEKKPRVPTMSERDLTRVHTAKH